MVPKKEERDSKRELLTSSDLRKAIQVELRRIRSLAKEIASNYVSKLEGRAEDMAKSLEEIQFDDRDDFRKLLKSIRELSVKPNKGRRKDLRKIEDLLDRLRGQIEAANERQEKRAKDAPSATAAGVVPRRRGRPPKHLSPVSGAVRRRRGRPPKLTVASSGDADAESSVVSVPFSN